MKPTSPPLRLRKADRQRLFRGLPLDQTVPPDHRVRAFVRLAERLDLSGFLATIRSVEGHAGRPAADPQVLIEAWLYAMDQGVTSARQLDRLCKEHDAYRWILGGVSTNYHQLSDIRVQHPEALEATFKQLLVLLKQEGLYHPQRQALDGTKVRASAGAASFRSETRLRRLLQRRSRRRGGGSSRRRSARARARRERRARLREALRRLPKAHRAQKPSKQKKPRSSTSDPQAHTMKMADGGFRPAYNVQLSTTTQETIIVAVRVTEVGSDRGQLEPMQKLLEKYGRLPRQQIVDGGFVKLADIERAEQRGVRIYAPEQKRPKDKAHRPRETDTPNVARWRQRMATDRAKAIYRERGSVAECVNADLKSHGLVIRVRGLVKVLQVGLWASLAHNLRRWLSLKRQHFKGSAAEFLHSL